MATRTPRHPTLDRIKAAGLAGRVLACPIAYPRYVVSVEGDVFSFVHRQPRRLVGGKMGEYAGLCLLNRDEQIDRVYRHVVVAETFHGARPDGLEVRHLDGQRDNCAAANLAWGTRSQNMRDKDRHGTATRGERHPQAKLNDRIVRLVRGFHRIGISPALVMRRFQISRMQHWRIVTRKAWSHVA